MTPVDALRVERSKYPASGLTREQKAAILNDAAFKVGGPWGLLLKPDGNNCPCGDKLIACDILVNRETSIHYDVFIDQEGSATISWQDKGVIDVSRWLAPKAPAGGGPVDPPPPPPPPPPPINDVTLALAEIRFRLNDLQASVVELRQAIEGLQDKPVLDLAGVLDKIDSVERAVKAERRGSVRVLGQTAAITIHPLA